MRRFFNLLLSLLPFFLISCSSHNEANSNQSDCRILIENENGEFRHINAPTVDLSKGADFKLPDTLINASSIMCSRQNLETKVNDFLVVNSANKPLMLFGQEAKIVIEMVNGQFRMRVIEGNLEPEQINIAQNAMNEAQLIVQGE